MALYGVYHMYDVDGGCGDAIGREDLIKIFATRELADAYAKKWDNTHVYERPYSCLYAGALEVKELPKLCDETELDVAPNCYLYDSEAIEPVDEDDDWYDDDEGNEGKWVSSQDCRPYSFVTDEEKMHDFRILTKEEFLESYSYLTEDEYDITKFYVDRALEYAEQHGIIEYHLEEGKMIFYTSFPMEGMTYKATVDLNQLTETREALYRYYVAYIDLVEGKYATNYMA